MAGNFVAHRVQTQTALVEDLRRHGTLFSQKSKQEVLGADVPVLQAVALFMREGQDSLCLGRQREFYRGGNLFSQQRAAFDLFANRLD